METYCVKCHRGKSAEGEVDLQLLVSKIRVEKNVETWQKILNELATGVMPPEDEKQPSRADRTKLVSWIKAELKKTGHGDSEFQRKLLYPEYGNLISHDLLFDGSINQPAWSPSRLWKRNPNQFNDLVRRGMGLGRGRHGRPHQRLAKIKQPFTIEETAGISDYAAIAIADSATLGTLMRNATTIVDQLLADAFQKQHEKIHGRIPDDQLPKDRRGRPIRKRYQKTPPAFAVIISQDKKPTDQQIDAATTHMFQTVIDDNPTAAETVKYRKLMRSLIAESDADEALRMTLIAIAISPRAIFRSEIGYGPADQHGRQILSPADLAFAISYALTDTKPDKQLLTAAREGRLKTREDVRREVARIWDDPAIDKPRILRFFHEFFGYTNAPKVFKDGARFGRGKDYRRVPEKLVTDADTLVNYIVKNDKQVFYELLTTEKYFVGHSGDNQREKQTNEHLKKFYQYFKDKPWKEFPYATPPEHAKYARSIAKMFSHPNGNVIKGWMRYLTMCDKNGITPMPTARQHDFLILYNLKRETFDFPLEQPFALAPGKRAGILMHPAWLLAHSVNLDNDPIRRGKWIRERLLADTVPELPITVDASIPEAPEQSLRERFAVTREKQCWRCHVKMNPLGMPFEAFDDFGRHRDRFEKLHAKGKTKPVDASGFLKGTGNQKLDGPAENPVEMIRRIAKSDRARQSFVRHAFRYWMGRNEMLFDSRTLRNADQAYTENNGSFRALVISLLTSDSFIYRKRIEK